MSKNKLLLLLVLLVAVATGAWAQTTINVTADDLGKAVCTDGSIYENVYKAQSAGKTAAAKIICLDTQNSKALALSLDNQAVTPSTVDYATAQSKCEALNTTLAVTFGTWVLPSKAQWEAMIEAAGGYKKLRDGIGTLFGGTKMEAVTYWSSTAGTTGHWGFNFNDGDWSDVTYNSSARACLVINLPQGYSITLAEGTEDGDNWTISPTEAAEGSPVTVTYSGEKKVKSVKAVKKEVGPEVTTFSELQALLSAGKDVKLMNDIVCTAEIEITSGALTIDGNGKTLSTTSEIRAFKVGASATVAFKNLTFTGFVNEGGPAINNSGTIVLDGCTISNCHVSNGDGGGAIENKSTGKLYAINTTFSGNYSGEIGGAINNYRGNLYMSNCTFTDNYTTNSDAYYGGAIGINMGDEVRLINCAFSGNKYGTNTGTNDIGVFNKPENYTIAGCTGATIASSVGDITTNASGTATLDYSDLSNILFTYSVPVTLATPLTVEAVTAGTIQVNTNGTLSTGMKYSVNGGTKTDITSTTTIEGLKAGDKVQFYSNGTGNTAYSNDPEVNISGGTAEVKVYGNIMSLLDEEGFATKTDLQNYAFLGLFLENTTLIDASELLMPAATLAAGCYQQMFQGCTALTKAPKLPATTLKTGCYYGMFQGCSALTAAPALPATWLAYSCYAQMFSGCTSLTSAYVKAAYKNESDECYKMFDGCTATGAVLHTTSGNKASWEGVMGTGKTWDNWTVAGDWQE